MKSLLSIVIGTSLLFGVFGLLGMSPMEHKGEHACPVAQILGGNCSSLSGNLTLTLHHIDGLLGLTGALVIISVLLLTVLVKYLAPILTRLLRIQDIDSKKVGNVKELFHQFFKPPIFLKLLHWLALHNKRNFLVDSVSA